MALKETLKMSYITLNLWRVTLIYITLTLLRTIFYLYNIEMIGAVSWSDVGTIMSAAFSFDSASIVYTNALWILLTFAPLRCRTKMWYRRVRYYLFVVSNCVMIVCLNLADAVYFRHTAKRFTSDELIFDDNGNNISLMVDFMVDNWFLLIAGAVIAYIFSKLYLFNIEPKDRPERAILYYPAHTLALIAMLILSVGGLRGSFSTRRPQTVTDAMTYTDNGNTAYLMLSNPFCLLRTLGKHNVVVPKYFPQEVADSLFTPYHYPTAETIAKAKYKGYNVMIFILESFSGENSAYLSPDLYEDGEVGYMPFVDSLMQSGVALRQMYANGGQSIAATPAIIGSIPSLDRPFTLLPESIGESCQMPRALGSLKEPYSSTFFCGSKRSSMGFVAYANKAGFKRSVTIENYRAKHGNKDFDGTWGIYDRPFMEFVGEELTHNTPKPFYAVQFTLTSHFPFAVDPNYTKELPEGETSVQKIITYSDDALRNFFEKFKNEKWFNKTIFVLVADHISPERIAERSNKYPHSTYIPAVIYTPDGSLKGEINEVTQQADIMPTLLGLLGYDKPYFAFGRDIFNEPERPHWSVCYVGGTQCYTHERGVERVEDSDLLKAYEQQYYTHIAKKSYVVK